MKNKWRRAFCCGASPTQQDMVQVAQVNNQPQQYQQQYSQKQYNRAKQQDNQQQQVNQQYVQNEQQYQQQLNDKMQNSQERRSASKRNGREKEKVQNDNSRKNVQVNQGSRQASSQSQQSAIQEDPYQRYEWLKDLGSGNFGVARLMRDKTNGKLVAVKFLERGEKIDKNVEREIINHRSLRHPNIVQFREVFLTNEHLGIVMEFAAGGELFDRIVKAGRFTEDEARYFFQQLISGVEYCHKQGICHRDLKLENSLLDGSPAPILKICDFGYSKSSMFDSQPKSTVGTPAYIAPEVLSRQRYDGYSADVWSCGVTLYVMLVGAYPFEDPQDPRNFRKTIQRIMQVKYNIPQNIKLSKECLDLLQKIFLPQPSERITIAAIKQHPWFLKNLPDELKDGYKSAINQIPESNQKEEDISKIIEQARVNPYKNTKKENELYAQNENEEEVY